MRNVMIRDPHGRVALSLPGFVPIPDDPGPPVTSLSYASSTLEYSSPSVPTDSWEHLLSLCPSHVKRLGPA